MADADGNEYGPFDLEVIGSQAEAFTETNWHDLDRTSGVLEGFGLTFNGRTAQLAAGFARIHGSWLRRRDTWTYDSPATTTSAPRRDLLVLRRTLTVGEGEGAVPASVVPLVITGAPATTPADPTYDPITDEPLWSWQVPGNGGATVTVIRDLRRSGHERPLQVNSKAERDALEKIRGRQVMRMDTDDFRIETWTGSKWSFRIEGLVAGTTDSDGLLYWTHGGGQTPVAWGLSLTAQATNELNTRASALAWFSDSSNLQLRGIRTDTNDYLVSNPIKVSWWAKF